MTYIRVFQPEDAAALAQLLHDSVHAIGVKDYSHRQLRAWSPRPLTPRRFLERVSDGRDLFVAINDQDEPVGFIELEGDGHIDCFYCRPDVAGTGIGKALYSHLESAARIRKLDVLFVEASEAAKRFFDKQGFTTGQRREVVRNGINIHNYYMEKRLGPAHIMC